LISLLLSAEFLGFKNYIPSFASARGWGILAGVDYASTASGIRNETGQNLVISCTFHKHSKFLI
jgi:hypothetical protein